MRPPNPNLDDDFPFKPRPVRPPSMQPPTHTTPRVIQRLNQAIASDRRNTRRAARAAAGKPPWTQPGHTSHQSVILKTRYSFNTSPGVWRVHGMYIQQPEKSVGAFDWEKDLDASKVTAEWQRDGDPYIIKLYMSPEMANELDLKRLTRETMARAERDMASGRIEWVAAVHTDKPHHHVHVDVRCYTGDNYLVNMHYLRYELVRHARDFATQQLGYRTPEQERADNLRQLERLENRREKGLVVENEFNYA
ncbi:MAG: hypothetical protein NVS1B6_04430 [Steroidobacteraceae bacterium]